MKKGTVTRWKKPLAALLGAVFVLGTVFGAGSALPRSVTDALPEGVREALPFGEMLAPLTAQAGSGYAMQEGAGGIENGEHIYFGTKDETNYTWTDAAPYWRVLDKTNTNAGTSGMFLLSET